MVELKRCGICASDLPPSEFHRDSRAKDGLQWRCKSCKRQYRESRREQGQVYAKQYRETHRDKIREYNEQYQENNPVKVKAWDRQYRDTHREKINKARRASYYANPEKPRAYRAIANAIKRGILIKQPCEMCGATERVDAHHDDYSKPLEIRWLCKTHHKQFHKEERNEQRKSG